MQSKEKNGISFFFFFKYIQSLKIKHCFKFSFPKKERETKNGDAIINKIIDTDNRYSRHRYCIVEPLFPRGVNTGIDPSLYVLAEVPPVVRAARVQVTEDPLLTCHVTFRSN